jgi:hypothetical protein
VSNPAAAREPARSTSRRVKPHPHPMMELPPRRVCGLVPLAARRLRYERFAWLIRKTPIQRTLYDETIW